MYKYEMIAEEIQKKIKDGTYPPDTRLPQEMEMCKIYDASRITIREAMELLVAKGLITKRRGAGTFVKAVAPGMTDQVGFSKSGQFSGFSKDQAGRKVSSDVHEFGLKKASKEVAEKLQVAENIACEKQENIDEPKLRTAMQLADIEDKVLSLPKKEKTAVTNFLDKDGVLFSGGELQRILLARALYKDAPLLLLDEPTSALDPLAETAIYEQYHRLSEGKTTIFISHRLASTKFCDRIIYYENGQVKEDGTHDELMKKNGAYAKMFEIQSQYYNEKGGDFDE